MNTVVEQVTTGATARGGRPDTTEGGQRFVPTHASWTGGRSLEAELEFQSTLACFALVDEPDPVLVGHDGRYAIHRLIGRGAMGAVYVADDLVLRRPVAVKVVSQRVANRERFQDRLRREAWALALLDHPNVLQIHDVDIAASGELFIVMQYVPGQNLREWAQEPVREQILPVMIAAGRGLAAAHAKGLVHRDFKPDNVLLHEHRGERRVLVADFGLAGGAPLRAGTLAGAGPVSAAALTSAGLLGTPAYMAPEQRRGELVDARSDQFAFCVTLWELLVGERPKLEVGLRRPRELPPWLYRLLRRGLAEAPGDRHTSMDALLDALERTPRRRRRLASLGGAALGGGVLALAGALWVGEPGARGASAAAAIEDDDAGERCLAAAAPLDELWTAGHRAELREHLLGIGVERIDSTMATIDAALGRRRLARYQACRDGSFEHQQGLFDRCLRRLDRRLRLLATLAPDRLEHMHGLVDPLRTDALCEAPPRPLDPEVQSLLDEAEDAELLADYGLAIERSEAALARAASLPSCTETGAYSNDHAAAAYRLGHVHGERHDGREALRWLDEATRHAIACEDDTTAIRSRLRAARNAAVDLQDRVVAEDRLLDAEPLLARGAAPPAPLRWEHGLTAGLVALHQGRPAAAREQFEGALSLTDAEARPLEAIETLINLGVAAHAGGELDAARAAFERAQAIELEVYGAGPPELDLLAFNRALMLLDTGAAQDRGEARALLERAAASEHVGVAIVALTALIQLEHELGELDSARELAPLLATLVRSHPEQAPRDRAVALLWAGQVLADGGDGEGLELMREALAVSEQFVPDWDQRDLCELSLAWNYLEHGQRELARAHHETLLARELDPGLREYARELGRELEKNHRG